jgi:hypothetical protein
MSWIRFALVFALLAVGGVLATRGTPDPQVSLASVVELWSDTLRDTDQIGMKLTRVSDAEEMKIGADRPEVSRTWGARIRMPRGTLLELPSPCCRICGVKGFAISFM